MVSIKTHEMRRIEPPRARLPFQVIERVNESRATRQALTEGKQLSLFDVYEGKEGNTFEDGWRTQCVIDAVIQSDTNRRWEAVPDAEG